MTDARANILARLQQGRRKPIPEEVVNAKITSSDASIEQFIRGLEKVSGTYETVTTAQQITGAIEAYLKQVSASNLLVVAPAITKAGLLVNSSLPLQPAPTRGNEENAVTLAYAGIAETGSLVMLSSADTPVTTNFLPDNFICVLKTKNIVNDMESLWERLQSEQGTMPRCVNIITGPSRTADVEQTIQMGAHGPRRVHVILWNELG